MTRDDDDAPERDRLRPRGRDHEIGPKKRTLAGAILGSVFGLAMVYAAVALLCLITFLVIDAHSMPQDGYFSPSGQR